MTKYIFVTGGVCSSLGKGVAASSLGCLLKCRGFRVTLQKFDPYLNVDPGTMSPFQHGEVFVTDDGAETDLDLGHYQRFVGCKLSNLNSVTTGQVYLSVIERERRGDYLGQTVQVIPHITGEIKRRIHLLSDSDEYDVHISEIGGTVGDIESIPFLEAIRQFAHEVGRPNAMFIHVTLVPHIGAADELKSKPTQHSVRTLREIGIFPDVLLCRSKSALTHELKKKIALFCDVDEPAVISARDIQSSIYEIPLMFRDQSLDEIVVRRLGLPEGERDYGSWQRVVEVIHNPKGEVEIGFVGKYVGLKDAYKSVDEALTAGGIGNEVQVRLRKVESEDIEKQGAGSLLEGVDGILVPGGFGLRGVEGKIQAAQYARENGVPYLGICLGMQCAVVEFARHVVGLETANTSEADPNTPHPVISLLTEQQEVTRLGGTMRLGAEPCDLVEGTRVREAYGCPQVSERHRHRYEYNPAYREVQEKFGMVSSGLSPKRGLVEMIELRDHPWFVGCQFHPEFRSSPRSPHPLFKAFIGAALECKAAREEHPASARSGEST